MVFEIVDRKSVEGPQPLLKRNTSLNVRIGAVGSRRFNRFLRDTSCPLWLKIYLCGSVQSASSAVRFAFQFSLFGNLGISGNSGELDRFLPGFAGHARSPRFNKCQRMTLSAVVTLENALADDRFPTLSS